MKTSDAYLISANIMMAILHHAIIVTDSANAKYCVYGTVFLVANLLWLSIKASKRE